jgi:Flp pilus assembly pilin Flp
MGRREVNKNMLRRSASGLLSLEYAILIALIVTALLGMSLYLKRALSGRFRDAADSFGFGRQYEP